MVNSNMLTLLMSCNDIPLGVLMFLTVIVDVCYCVDLLLFRT